MILVLWSESVGCHEDVFYCHNKKHRPRHIWPSFSSDKRMVWATSMGSGSFLAERHWTVFSGLTGSNQVFWIVSWMHWLSIRIISACQLELEHVVEAFSFHLLSVAKVQNVKVLQIIYPVLVLAVFLHHTFPFFLFLWWKTSQNSWLKLMQVWFSSMGLNEAVAQVSTLLVRRVSTWWILSMLLEKCMGALTKSIAYCIRKPLHFLREPSYLSGSVRGTCCGITSKVAEGVTLLR